MTYLVMETKFSYVILLAENGKYYYGANLGYEVGQRIENPIILQVKKKKMLFKPISIFASTLALACALLLFINSQRTITPILFSKIYLTINPEVVMSVDEDGTVFELSALDNDGSILIDGYDYENKDEVQVTRELINRASELSFLKEGMSIIIEIDNDEGLQAFGPELRQAIDQEIDDSIDLQIVKKGTLVQEEVEENIPIVEEPIVVEESIVPIIEEPIVEEPTIIENNDSNYDDNNSNYDNSSNYDASNYENNSNYD